MTRTWSVEALSAHEGFLVLDGIRVARMTPATAWGIAKALNGPEGQRLFEEGRQEFLDNDRTRVR